jgi:predicted amidophosphoribosyltransferase
MYSTPKCSRCGAQLHEPRNWCAKCEGEIKEHLRSWAGYVPKRPVPTLARRLFTVAMIRSQTRAISRLEFSSAQPATASSSRLWPTESPGGHPSK